MVFYNEGHVTIIIMVYYNLLREMYWSILFTQTTVVVVNFRFPLSIQIKSVWVWVTPDYVVDSDLLMHLWKLHNKNLNNFLASYLTSTHTPLSP